MTNIERYKNYCDNGFDWRNRFTWNGLFGNNKISSISINNFNNDTQNLVNLNFKNTLDFYNQMKKMSIIYSNWCKSKKCNLSEEEIKHLQLFFIGAIGEYFFVKLFEHKNTLVIKSKQNLFTFYNIAPRDISEMDFGIDLTGIVTQSNKNKSYDAAFQVKFWNPYNDESLITNAICSEVFTDATINNMIDINDDNNLFVCWLGDDKHLSKWLKKNNKLFNHFIFIDRQVLKDNIDNDTEFWIKISNEISNI